MNNSLPSIDPIAQDALLELLAQEALRQFGHDNEGRGGVTASKARIASNPDFQRAIAGLIAAEVAQLEGQLSEAEKLLKAGGQVRDNLSPTERLAVDSRLVELIAQEIPKAADRRLSTIDMKAALVGLLKDGADPRQEGVNPYDLAKRNGLTTAVRVLEDLGLDSLEILAPNAFASACDLQVCEFETVRLDPKGKPGDRQRKRVQTHEEDLGNGIKLTMVRIPGGSFWMGSPGDEAQRRPKEGPRHQVAVPEFYLGQTAVTQGQWQAIMGNNPAKFKGSDRLPVERVSWQDCQEFCRRLTARTESQGRIYRLPSEAEWEYACRGGVETPFHYGETITTELANYNGNEAYGNGPAGSYRKRPNIVGQFAANDFGLHDLHGNIWERCQDEWHDNYEEAPTDGRTWQQSDAGANNRVMRGGSWFSLPGLCRCASRDSSKPGDRSDRVGLRIAYSLPQHL
ncbi:MAG: formylglycine-generating enzyme family protein [Cyanobacteria bacterium J06641_5]